ncbi:hypothetical protein [Roseibacillus persicicus]|uniref:Uncharacterized protein n=1 Tax=Roseibacillus persicicus TaxID=454148 RepID=A0A918TE57_9BACT|nr:hypothetical protein [Roseibacillus persicicus]GHC41942.1 hypothetical protein GCM10007100_03590 [Roseibacillus persicicus]
MISPKNTQRTLLFGLLTYSSLALSNSLPAQESAWKNEERIAISADGNPDADPDDIGATPFTLAVLAKAGLQDNLVHYDFNNFMEYKPIPPEKNEMWRGAMGGQARWGFDREDFFDVSQDPAAAVENLTREIDRSTADDPLYIIEAGPADLIYRALKAADERAREHVTLVSHSGYNDFYRPRPWLRNLEDIRSLVPNLNYIKIPDQNAGLRTHKDYEPWNWLRDHEDPNLKWVYERMRKGLPDVSDSGMICWLIGLSGEDQKISIPELVSWFGSDPIPANGGSSDAPSAPPAVTPEINYPVTESIFEEVDGKLVIEAESVEPTGDWVLDTTEEGYTGKGYLRYMPDYIHAITSQTRGVLTYKLRITTPGTYRLALKHSHKGAPERDKWNDCWTLIGIDPHPWGSVRKTYHSVTREQFESGVGFTYSTTHNNYGPVAHADGEFSKPSYELKAGDQYFFIMGRSGGYRLDKIHLFKEGVEGFGDDSQPMTPILSGDS